MRVTRVRVRGWRNLADIEIVVPPEARFICLVGENGTGKSSILELLTWAAHHLGLAPQANMRRVAPTIPTGSEHEIEITVALDPSDGFRAELAQPHPPQSLGVEAWNGELTFWTRTWAGETPPAGLPPWSFQTSTNPDGGMTLAVFGGPDDGDRGMFGAAVVGRLREKPELLHLYIDAERVFPPGEVGDTEILALARQDQTLPAVLKQQAAQLTQNLYLEWMRSMLGAQQRFQAEYFQSALDAGKKGLGISAPPDPLATYRDGLAQVLPHLRFVRLDHDTRRLVFDSAGSEVAYEELSGGERELAFLVGQLDRFGMRDGLFLLDEPELHLNPELLRGWLDYLRGTITSGQAWVATHSLEAAEIAGPAATFVIERGDDRMVRSVSPLAGRPALSTLAAAVGTPAFSVARSRFVLIEGRRERRERERFATVLGSAVADRFIEADGCTEVIDRMRALRSLASEEEQLRVAAIIDRDFRTQDERESMAENPGVHVLSVHEIENLFLQPDLVAQLLLDVGREGAETLSILQCVADPDAGRWAFEKAKAEEGWRDDLQASARRAGELTWQDIETDVPGAARNISDCFTQLKDADRARRRLALEARITQYSEVRQDATALHEQCMGKEGLRRLAGELGFKDESAIEARAAVLWRNEAVERPPAAHEIRAYLDSVPVLSV